MFTAQSIAGSDYVGWVAWIDGSPVFEHVSPTLLQVPSVAGATVLPVRHEQRNVREWTDLPLKKIERVDLYWARESGARQPVFRWDRQPGYDEAVPIQYKGSGIIINTGGGDAPGSMDLGLLSYFMGVWDPVRGECEIHEFHKSLGHRLRGRRKHPCLPPPDGFGLERFLVGL